MRVPLRVAVLFLLAIVPLSFLRAQDALPFTGPFVISGIVIEGNKHTLDQVVLREMPIAEGDTVPSTQALYEQIERSRQNVMNLSLFNSVHVIPTFLNDHEVFLTVTVIERWFYWPTPILRYSDPNFNTWWLTKDLSRLYWGAYLYRYNMRRRNETLYVKLQFGYSHEFGFRYRFPFISRKQRMGLSFGGGYSSQEEITVGTRDNLRVLLKVPGARTRYDWRGDVELTWRPKFDLRYAVRLQYLEAHVLDTVIERTPNYFTRPSLLQRHLTLGAFIAWDARDSKTFPLEGHYMDLRADRTGLGLASTNAPELTTMTATAMKVWHTGDRWSVGGSLRGKASLGPDLPYYNQQGLGYDDQVRGYEYYVSDGEHYVLAKANVLWALYRPREFTLAPVRNEQFRTLYLAVYLNAFVDAGRVWDSRYGGVNPLNNTWQQAAGLGLDLVTSYDQVFRIEYTVNRRNEQTFYLHFAHPF